jgi:hypothetical protein
MSRSRQTESRVQPGPHAAQVRKALTVDEILQLEAALMEVFRTIRQLKERSPAAKHIKFPPLPAAFSESIAIVATPLLFGSDWTGRYGGSLSDLIVENTKTCGRLRVEVKATGRHAFQELKEKNLQADVLLWIRFGTRFERGSGPIMVAVIESPGKYIGGQCRLDIRRIENIPGIRDAQKVHQFETLESMLGAPAPCGRQGSKR